MKRINITLFIFLLSALTIGNVHAAGDAAAGKAKYDSLCAGCHGIGGKGDGPAAAALKPSPANLTISKLDVQGMTKIVTEGGAAVGRSPMMAAFGSSLKPEELAAVVAYVKSLPK